LFSNELSIIQLSYYRIVSTKERTAVFSNKSVYFRAEVGLTSALKAGLRPTVGLIWLNSNWYKTFNLLTTWPTIREVLTVLNSPLINWVMISAPIEPHRGSVVGSVSSEISKIIQSIIQSIIQASFVYTSSLRAVKLTSNVTHITHINNNTIIWETHTSNALQVVHQFTRFVSFHWFC